MQLRAVAEAHEARRAEERAAREQEALSEQVEAQRQELAHFEARLRQEREELALQHARQDQSFHERDQSLFRRKQEVASEQDLQQQRQVALSEQVKAAKNAHSAREAEERINNDARRIGEQQANAGRAWQQVQFNAAKVEKRVRKAEDKGYARATREAAARAAVATLS
uniref:Uncharacterized protein n=1 Tax=Peronospora matthiolae TaxID=2874970 RepID=A0AAV1U6E0_9STRA